MYEKQRSMGTYEGSALMAELAARKAAGAPKDEAAEHVFLRNMSNEWGIPLGVIAGWREGARRRARAECAVETQAAREKANADAHAYADEFKVKPLQAEIERLKAQLSGVGMQEFRRLEGRLHNAQAEIERLKSLSDGLARAAATLVADNSTLQTELTEQAAEIERLKVQLQEQRAANTESHEADYQEGYENGWAEGLGMEVK
jgi:predicted RNase H-like nuclease (RuvC/YqgF family)